MDAVYLCKMSEIHVPVNTAIGAIAYTVFRQYQKAYEITTHNEHAVYGGYELHLDRRYPDIIAPNIFVHVKTTNLAKRTKHCFSQQTRPVSIF